MKIVVFGASSSRSSVNKAFAEHAADLLTRRLDVELELLDLNGFEMPIYSIDREREGGIPEHARRFYEAIGQADGVIVSYAEHNGLYTAAFKNVFDWASRIQMKVFQGKPVLALSASVGGRGGASVLKAAVESAPFFGAEIVDSMSVPRVKEAFDFERGELVDEALAVRLGEALERFAARLESGAAQGEG